MNSLNGFIKLHRKLIAWGWYQDYVVKDVFLHLLLTANFKETSWRSTTLKEGQLVTSYKHLSEDLGFSVQKIRTAIDKLKSTGEITTESTNKYTVITVVNWADYQFGEESDNQQNNKQSNNQATSRFCEQTVNKNKKVKKSTSKSTNNETAESGLNTEAAYQFGKISTSNLTNNQQTNNNQITNKQQQRKNIKNDKNKRNNNIYAHSSESDGFDIFWFVYPRKVGKKDAIKAWNQIKPDKFTTEKIISGVERWKRSEQWTKDEGRFIPYPATFLRGERYNEYDRVETATLQKAAPIKNYDDEEDFFGGE